jgi:hypothetical protein
MRPVALRGMVQDRQGSHLEDQSGSDMGLRGHQGRQREDSHRAGTGHVGGSCGAVAADAADLAAHPDEAATAVPIVNVSATASQRGCIQSGYGEVSQKEGNGKYPHGFALSVV